MRSIRTPAERAVHARIHANRDSHNENTDNGVFPRAADSATSSSTTSAAKSASTPSSSTGKSSSVTTAQKSSTSTTSTTKPVTSSSSSTSHSSTTSVTTSSSSSSSHTTTTSHLSAPPTANTILPAPSSLDSQVASAPSVTPSAANDASQADVTSASKGPSGAVIGVVVALIIVVILGIGFFIMRKRAIRRRETRRNTWGAGIFPDFKDEKSSRDLAPPVPEKADMSAMDHSGLRYQLPSQMRTSFASSVSPNIQVALTPPPTSYNNPVADNAFRGFSSSSSSISGSTTGTMMEGRKTQDTAIVRCVFIPSLPDELSITGGEVVYVLAAYDDGWAFCENARGEQGMIPLECLGRSGQTNSTSGLGEQETNVSAWRNSKRVSSLHGGNPMGRF